MDQGNAPTARFGPDAWLVYVPKSRAVRKLESMLKLQNDKISETQDISLNMQCTCSKTNGPAIADLAGFVASQSDR